MGQEPTGRLSEMRSGTRGTPGLVDDYGTQFSQVISLLKSPKKMIRASSCNMYTRAILCKTYCSERITQGGNFNVGGRLMVNLSANRARTHRQSTNNAMSRARFEEIDEFDDEFDLPLPSRPIPSTTPQSGASSVLERGTPMASQAQYARPELFEAVPPGVQVTNDRTPFKTYEHIRAFFRSNFSSLRDCAF